MALSDRRRKVLFMLALAVLIAWGGVVAVLGSGAGPRDPGGRTGERTARPRPGEQPTGHPRRPAGVGPALDFLAAYLRYERGTPGRADRQILARLSTPGFGRQLLSAPVRMPAAGGPRPEWVSRVETVRVGIFEGHQALLVGVVVVAPGGAHVVTPTLVRRHGQWLVAGLGG
jgi:hypothetical protein